MAIDRAVGEAIDLGDGLFMLSRLTPDNKVCVYRAAPGMVPQQKVFFTPDSFQRFVLEVQKITVVQPLPV